MNASYAFRSHLMQQFAAQARSQARPPLALFGLLSDDNNNPHHGPPPEDPEVSRTTSPFWQQQLSSIDDSSTNGVNLRRRHTDSDVFSSYNSSKNNHRSLFLPLHSRDLSASAAEQERDELDHADGLLQGTFNLPLEFQTLLQTRRTQKLSLQQPLTTALSPLAVAEHEYWLSATDRAIECGYQASKRTEPLTFKRLIAPSPRTERLAEIAYHVTMRQTEAAAAAKEDPTSSSNSTTLSRDKVLFNKKKLRSAERKREKWSRIPAFLVATVQEEEEEDNTNEKKDKHIFEQQEHEQYESLPYVPPRTVRALEDYAAACAACQNVMLSLHAEHIATKWVTGNIVATPAFRELIQANHTDRVVGIILVGQPVAQSTTTTRTTTAVPSSHNKNSRHRRSLRDGNTKNALVDL